MKADASVFPRCGAAPRKGREHPCRSKPVLGADSLPFNGRCRMHGGLGNRPRVRSVDELRDAEPGARVFVLGAPGRYQPDGWYELAGDGLFVDFWVADDETTAAAVVGAGVFEPSIKAGRVSWPRKSEL